MSGTRLYVGGLSPGLEESVLRDELCQFLTVSKLDVKEKKDIVTGDLVKRFAFVTVDSPSSKVDQCISALDGKCLDGSVISIERAQESFIEKLKREREAKALGIEPIKPREDNQYNWGKSESAAGGRPDTYNSNDDYQQDAKRVKQSDWSEKVSQVKTPEEIWRESVQDHNKETEESPQPISCVSVSSTHKDVSMVRYDPRKPSKHVSKAPQPQTPQMTTKISESLAFTGASASFSLLSMFSSNATSQDTGDAVHESDDENTDVQPQRKAPATRVNVDRTLNETAYVKKIKFFLDPSDPEIAENFNWIYQKPDQTRLNRFQEDRKMIVKVYGDRSRKTQSERRNMLLPKEHYQLSVETIKDKMGSSSTIKGKMLPKGKNTKYSTKSGRGRTSK